MSSKSAKPRPEPKYSYFWDTTSRLTDVIDITNSSGAITTYQYSIQRPGRSSDSNPKNLLATDGTRMATDKKEGE